MLNHVIIGEGWPLLVLHGSGLDHRHMMESLEPVFASVDGWQRIYVDLPGHGKSPADDGICSQDDLLNAVIAFAREALPGQRFAVIGESRGSYLASGMAHLIPASLNGVGLIVPGGSPTADPARLPIHQVLEPDPSIRPELAKDELGRFDNFMVVQNRAIVEKTRRSKLPAFPLFDAAQEERVRSHFDFSFDTQGSRTRFDGPSLIVAGRQDSMSGYLDAVDLLPHFPRATLAALDSAGHGLTWERPELFAALMQDWLQRMALVE